MTTFALLSDVHANLEALEAVLDQVQGLELYFLGDFVDYGANPNEVVGRLKARGAHCVIGNHDQAALDGDTSMFNREAAISSAWSRKQLTAFSTEFIRSVPRMQKPRLNGTDAFFAHGSPDDLLWEYVDPGTHHLLFGHYLAKLGVKLIGLGHTHLPYVWSEEGGLVVNPGSVGQPRDGDWRASYALVTVDEKGATAEVRRVEYDCESAAAKIRDAGLPRSHADRLLPRGRNG